MLQQNFKNGELLDSPRQRRRPKGNIVYQLGAMFGMVSVMATLVMLMGH